MSSNNLISSLFTSNSFTRSSSLLHKSLGDASIDYQRARSQSTTRNRNPNLEPNSRTKILNKLAHILAVKVKKHNYFLFCRLEANNKKRREQENSRCIQAELTKQSSLPSFSEDHSRVMSPPRPLPAPRNQNISKGLESLETTITLMRLKQSHVHSLQQSFQRIKNRSSKVKGAESLAKGLLSVQKAHLCSGFKKVSEMEKLAMKMEILQDVVKQHLSPLVHEAFTTIRESAIERMIEQENQRREQERIANERRNRERLEQEWEQQQKIREEQERIYEQKMALQRYSGSKFEQLKEISEEESSALSEEETARFVVSHDEPRRSSEDITFRTMKKRDVDSAVTPRKQVRRDKGALSSRKKQKCFVEQDESEIEHCNCSNHKQDKIKPVIKAVTKIQPRRPKIGVLKAMTVKTLLEDDKTIELEKRERLGEQMAKSKILFHESVVETVPDHDNITFFKHFESFSTNKLSEEGFLTSRTDTLEPPKQADPVVTEFDDESSQFESQNFKSSRDRNLLRSPNFKEEISRKEGSSQREEMSKERKEEEQMNYVSTPLSKIEEMMLDLERISQMDKSHKKYSTGYHKCKISVNLPRRSGENSCQSSASKLRHAPPRSRIAECRSDKKNLRKSTDAGRPWKMKDARELKEQKENIEVKLWDEKEKFLFYPDVAKRERKKNSTGYMSTMDQSLLNTARKMKKEIDGIINNRNSRSSLGTLKIVRNKL